MSRNSFGTLFRLTTFGESHGECIGGVVDGCPAGLRLSIEEIQIALDRRRPGHSHLTSPRIETDKIHVLSGLFEGKTTGAPIAFLIHNQQGDSSKYEGIKDLYRPGHASYPYLEKYGIFDHRGGGRASARETAIRVAAGAIAKQVLGVIKVNGYLKSAGNASTPTEIEALIEELKREGNSIGGVVEVRVDNVPVGLGDPVYEKLEAKLAYAMLSIPASKGFEIGEGFRAATMKGDEHNDAFDIADGKVFTTTNHAGGVLAGISNGMPILFRVAFKPTSSIFKPIHTINTQKEKKIFSLEEGSQHDPCVAIRAVAVVEAMTYLVLADCVLLNHCSKI
jgi:chorismate synthase